MNMGSWYGKYRNIVLEWKKRYNLEKFSVYEDYRFLTRDTVHSDKSIMTLHTILLPPTSFLLMQAASSSESLLHGVSFH
jgi:hypothetical protein